MLTLIKIVLLKPFEINSNGFVITELNFHLVFLISVNTFIDW